MKIWNLNIHLIHFDRCVPLQTWPFLWVADFDRQLSDENTNESIDETYACGQKWPNYGTHRESE